MKKYLVDIYLPAAGQHFDAFLPANKRIYEVVQLLANVTGSLASGDYKATKDAMLLNAENGQLYDMNSTVYDAGIRNAARLVFI